MRPWWECHSARCGGAFYAPPADVSHSSTTVHHEGGDSTPSLFAIAETTPLQLPPSIAWLSAHSHARRWMLVGNDYIYPWVTHGIARASIACTGDAVVGEMYLPFGVNDYSEVIDRIRRSRADAVLIDTDRTGRGRVQSCFRLCGPMQQGIAAVGHHRGEPAPGNRGRKHLRTCTLHWAISRRSIPMPTDLSRSAITGISATGRQHTIRSVNRCMRACISSRRWWTSQKDKRFRPRAAY